MCVYCTIGDYAFRHDPPWKIDPYHPQIPQPASPWNPINPWSVDKLQDFMDLLRRVKKLEDKMGCPCEPNKADYIKLLKDRILELGGEVPEEGEAA
jgi:hypothetical protein